MNNNNEQTKQADFNSKKHDIISDANIKSCYFFYINNISKNFDLDLQDYHFDESDELKQGDLENLKEFQQITKSSTVIKVINKVFNRIASLTTSKNNSLFVNLNGQNDEPFYLSYDKNNDFSSNILGNIHTNKMYSFTSYVSKNSYLYRFVDQLSIMFYLQQDTNRIVGGIVLNKLDKDSDNFNDTFEDFYLSNLVNTFVCDQLYPYDLELLLNIDKKKMNLKSNQAIDLDVNKIKKLSMQDPNLVLLKSNWEKLIQSKFLKYKPDFDDKEIDYYKNTLFFSVMSLWMIVVHLVEELDEYFTSGNEQKLINLAKKKEDVIKNVNMNDTQDFLSIANYLKVTKTLDVLQKKFDNYSLSEPKLVFDLYSENKLFLLDFDQIVHNRYLTSYLMAILFRNEYGINDINANFLNIEQVRKLLNEDVINGFAQEQIVQLKRTLFTQNFDYDCFVNDEIIVILHNKVNANETTSYLNQLKRVVNFYIWGLLYIVTKELEMKDLQTYTNYLVISNQKSKVVYFRQLIRDIDDIKFNWDDDFFGIKQIKTIVFALNTQTHMMEELKDLANQITQEDEIFKRQSERTSIILSFIIALLIGYVDFLSCVFSILPCSWTIVPWNWILGTIGFTTFTTTINMIILVWTIVNLVVLRSQYKNIDARNKRIRYSYGGRLQYVKTK